MWLSRTFTAGTSWIKAKMAPRRHICPRQTHVSLPVCSRPDGDPSPGLRMMPVAPRRAADSHSGDERGSSPSALSSAGARPHGQARAPAYRHACPTPYESRPDAPTVCLRSRVAPTGGTGEACLDSIRSTRPDLRGHDGADHVRPRRIGDP